MRHLLSGRTFVFIGFGMELAIRDQIRWVLETFHGAGGGHYVLTKDAAAMERDLHGLSVQTIPYSAHGQPLLDLMAELAKPAAHSPAAAKSAPRDPRPYLQYLRNDTALIEIRGFQGLCSCRRQF